MNIINCALCGDCLRESFPREMTALRCFSPEAGSYYGRVTHLIKTDCEGGYNMEPPTWCPRTEK